MAKAKQQPVLSSPLLAKEAFERDLEKVLKRRGNSLSDLRWERLGDLCLFVPVIGRVPGSETVDQYLVKLEFGYYPEWPPSTIFVNPNTRSYDLAKDKCWLPSVVDCTEFRVHDNYQQVGQVVCSSVTLEFYKVLHDVKPEHVWNPEKQNFGHTIYQVEWALNSSFHKGRQSALAA